MIHAHSLSHVLQIVQTAQPGVQARAFHQIFVLAMNFTLNAVSFFL